MKCLLDGARFIALCLTLLALPLGAQGGASPTPTKKTDPGSSISTDQEAFVILHHRVRMAYQADGTGEKHEVARIKVQTEAGVNALGQLHWGYNAANETLEVVAVKVHKPDGRIITAPAEAVQDLAIPGIEAAPVYTDLRMKVVTVPALRPGDELEIALRVPRSTPYAPGHFWGEHRFNRNDVTIEEIFELDLPKSKAVNLSSSPGMNPVTKEVGDRRVTSWTWKHPVREPQPTKESTRARTPKAELPDLEFTTFRTWAEAGDWFAGLEMPQRKLDESLRSKAGSLTAKHASPADKVRALYEFVATTNRYVSLSFGVGRFQPHKASEVLANQYGDCKDKHTLLAALLEAEGFKAHSVLVHTARELKPSLPSPGQFDHVITAVELGGETIYLDTTSEVAPFRVLLQPLRNKQALLVGASGVSRLVVTPSANPQPNRTEIVSEGEVTDRGDVKVSIQERNQGDLETLTRTMFRKVPQARWKDMVSYGATMNGLIGEVGEIRVSDPSDLSTPFVLAYGFTRAKDLQPSTPFHFLLPPLARMRLQAQSKEDGNLYIGEGTVIARLSLKLPKGLVPKLPLGIQLKRDFASYQSIYGFEGDRFTIERRLEILKPELTSARETDFEAFKKLVEKDHVFSVDIEGELPSPNLGAEATADALSQAAHQAHTARDYAKARDLYERLSVLDPKNKEVWNNLGRAHHALGAFDKAVKAYQKAIELNPNEEYAYNNLGLTLWAKKDYPRAEAMFRKQLEVNPYDTYAHRNLGRMFLESRNYPSAAEELELATRVDREDAMLRVQLAEALLNTKSEAKALDSLEAAVKLGQGPMVKNNAAYILAQYKVGLGRAKEWAESAVQETVEALKTAPLKPGDPSAGILTASLASFWDTLGWVFYQQGDLASAEIYLEAAWDLSQSSEIGVHLGQLYLSRGQKSQAAKTFAMAGAAPHPLKEAQEQLSALLGGMKAAKERIQKSREELAKERTITLPQFPRSSATAEYIFVLHPAGKIGDVLFLSGDENLKGMTETLKGMRHGTPLPDVEGLRVFRRGVLVADISSRTTTVVFMTTDVIATLPPQKTED